MKSQPQKQQAKPSPNKNPDTRYKSEFKKAYYKNNPHANGTHEEGKKYQERSRKNDDADTPERDLGEKISTGVKIVGAVTSVVGIVAGSATVIAVGAAAIGGAIVYDQIRKE